MAKARPIPELSAEEPMARGAARILAVRTDELLEHSRDVLDTRDIEQLHSMRVATRRLRAALEVFEACFPADLQASVLAEVKELADALGERRDRDVAIDSLSAFADELSMPDRRGVSSLVETLRLEQAEVNQDLRPYVAPERIASLCDRLGELVAEAERLAGLPAGPERLASGAATNGGGALS
jgi:CHAD domain-containing protein